MKQEIINRCVETAYALYPSVREHRCSHFAFLIKKNRLFKLAWNRIKSHPKNREYGYSPLAGLHSELAVTIKAGKEDLSDYELLVIRIDMNMRLNASKPCSGCWGVIKQTGIYKVTYSNAQGSFETIYPGQCAATNYKHAKAFQTV